MLSQFVFCMSDYFFNSNVTYWKSPRKLISPCGKNIKSFWD